MKALLKVTYEEVNTKHGTVKRQRWVCSRCNKKYTVKYVARCTKCGADLVNEPVQTWKDYD